MVADITEPGGKANALLLQKNTLSPLSVATSLMQPIKKEYTHTKAIGANLKEDGERCSKIKSLL
jgi:hypothetical protein